MFRSDAYALIVGIDDYSTLDASLGQAVGSSDLGGAVNDACAWYAVARELGVPPENIQLLTSPPIDPATRLGEEGALCVEATGAAVAAGQAWLVEAMSRSSRPSGLVFLGGHSVYTEPSKVVRWRKIQASALSTALVPSDATGRLDDEGELVIDEALPLMDLKAQVDAAGVGERLTVLVDLCHAPALPRVGRRARQLLGKLAARLRRWPGLGTRMLSACEPHQISEEGQFGGRVHGAFTWALTTAFVQWKVVREGQGMRSTASYATLVAAADRLLQALRFDQRVSFRGLDAVGALPFFHPELTFAGQTADEPDRRGPPRQLSPGTGGFRVYQFDLGTASSPAPSPSLGVVLCTFEKSPDGTYLKDREYWRIDKTALGEVASQGVSIWLADCTWDAIAANSGLAARVNWSPSGGHLWVADRVPASVASCSGAPSGGRLLTRSGSGARLALHITETSSEPEVLWFHEDADYLFESQSTAQFTSTTTGAYEAQFSTSHRVKLVDGGDPAGWYEFTSAILSTGSMT